VLAGAEVLGHQGRVVAALNGHMVFKYLQFGQNEFEFTNENSERGTRAAGGR
jgi:hypothetical protein